MDEMDLATPRTLSRTRICPTVRTGPPPRQIRYVILSGNNNCKNLHSVHITMVVHVCTSTQDYTNRRSALNSPHESRAAMSIMRTQRAQLGRVRSLANFDRPSRSFKLYIH